MVEGLSASLSSPEAIIHPDGETARFVQLDRFFRDGLLPYLGYTGSAGLILPKCVTFLVAKSI